MKFYAIRIHNGLILKILPNKSTKKIGNYLLQ